jgi:hypothetical protein
MAMAARNNGDTPQTQQESSEESQDCFAPPALSFAWMKILLNCCLQSQMSPIKKLIMHEILS